MSADFILKISKGLRQFFASPHSTNYKGERYKLSAQRFLGSIGWTSVTYDRLMVALNTNENWIKTNACTPKPSQKSLQPRLVPISIEFLRCGLEFRYYGVY